jgi:RNA polymerase sigma-70 factor (ECF subfamily)
MDTIKEITYNISLGDEKSFKRFFDIYKGKIYSYLLSIVKINEIAEELTSDVFLKIWLKRSEFKNIENVDGYVFIIAKNKALDFLRAASRNKKLQEWVEESFLDKEAQNSQDSIATLLERRESVKKILEGLTVQRREIITLSHIEGYTYEEISNHLQISKNTVRNTIVQTIKVLQKWNSRPEIDAYWLIIILPYFF